MIQVLLFLSATDTAQICAIIHSQRNNIGCRNAAIGSIAGAVIVIGQRSVTDWITATIAIATAAILWRFKKLPEPIIVIVAAVVGLVVHPLVMHA